MENIIRKYLLFSILFVSLISCSDILEKQPLDEISDEAFWSDPTLVDYYVNDVYSELYMDLRMGAETRTDNTVSANHDGSSRLDRLRFNYDIETAAEINDDLWNELYISVRKCNRFFEKIDISTVEVEVKDKMKGEIHFLRAMYYFDLAKRYGGVVLLDRILSMDDEWKVPRSSADDTYQFILDDLKKAITYLPTKWNGKDAGRATQGAAWALKSRVELYTEQYGEAIKSCAEVYKLGYDLVDGKTPEDYRSIWWTTNKDNKEIIFSKQFKGPDVYNAMIVYHMVTYINTPYGDRGWGGMSPTQDLVDEFELKDGTAAPQFNAKTGQSFDLSVSKIYEDREPRFYANIVFHGSHVFLKGDKGPALVDRYTQDTPDKGDGSSTGYNTWKWIDYDNFNYPYAGSGSKDHSINWVYLRYAEVILNDAEARLETNDIAGALIAVNKIRERVGLPNLTETNQGKLRELIRKERRIELAFEEHRFWDVRRWKIGEETQKVMYGLRFTSLTEFKVEAVDRRTWGDRQYLHPIPHEEILRTNIEQNPGF